MQKIFNDLIAICSRIVDILYAVGHSTINFLVHVNRVTYLLISSLFAVFSLRLYKYQALKAGFEIFLYSLTVIFLTSFFTGAVLTIQTYSGLEWLANSDTVARVVAVAITTEIGPVLTGIMIAGRIASSIAAEIATMNVSDQINALKTLSINPYRYLMYPRILAGILVLPMLLCVSDVIGIFGSYVVAHYKYKIATFSFLSAVLKYITLYKLSAGFTKAAIFGFLITFVSCLVGFHSQEGAKGVGEATTNAVVISSILILVSNYFITLIFFGS